MITNQYPKNSKEKKFSEKALWKKFRETMEIFRQLEKDDFTFTIGDMNAYMG